MYVETRIFGQVSLEISRCCSESMLTDESFRHSYKHHEDYVMRFKKNSVEPGAYSRNFRVPDELLSE